VFTNFGSGEWLIPSVVYSVNCALPTLKNMPPCVQNPALPL